MMQRINHRQPFFPSMHRFDYSEFSDSIPADIAGLVARIREVSALDRIRGSLYPKELGFYQELARRKAVKHSNAIDDITVRDRRFSEIVIQGDDGDMDAEDQIAGYRDALSLVLDDPLSFDLCERSVLSLHGTMMARTPGGGGSYKECDNAFVGHSMGRRVAVCETVPAAEAEDAMERLFSAYAEAREGGMDPLLLIPCAILDFLCISPFPGGNGRMSRLLTEAMLLGSGFDACRYFSMDERIDRSGPVYYRALVESSKG